MAFSECTMVQSYCNICINQLISLLYTTFTCNFIKFIILLVCARARGGKERRGRKKYIYNIQRLFLNKSIAAYFFFHVHQPLLIRGSVQFAPLTKLQLRDATASRDIENGEWQGKNDRGRIWVRGNADICQEIDNSNKLVAKHSNRLPNGTIVHSNPRLRTKHRISPRCNGCTCVRESDASTSDTMHIACSLVFSAPANWLQTDLLDEILFQLLFIKSCRRSC